jgi:transcription elongation factor GreA
MFSSLALVGPVPDGAELMRDLASSVTETLSPGLAGGGGDPATAGPGRADDHLRHRVRPPQACIAAAPGVRFLGLVNGGRRTEAAAIEHGSPHIVSTPTDEQDQGVWLTQEAHNRLKAELDKLVANRPVMAKEINDRREEGDLKENGGYHAAREEQGKQEGRIRQLTDLLRKARVGEPPTTATNAALGTVITVAFDGDEDDIEKFLLGSREIAGTTELTVYSPESALGAAIVGAAPGATVTYQAPNGRDISVKVLAVEPFIP